MARRSERTKVKIEIPMSDQDTERDLFDQATTSSSNEAVAPVEQVKPGSVEEEEAEEEEISYKCDHEMCQTRKPFSSLSSLNQHKKIKHEGIRWICPFCQEEQSSKHSHKRHIDRFHPEEIQNIDVDENQYKLDHRVTMTEKAKQASPGVFF